MNKRKLQAMANEIANDVKNPEDLSTLCTFLTVEAALKAEMGYHLGCEKND